MVILFGLHSKPPKRKSIKYIWLFHYYIVFVMILVHWRRLVDQLVSAKPEKIQGLVSHICLKGWFWENGNQISFGKKWTYFRPSQWRRDLKIVNSSGTIFWLPHPLTDFRLASCWRLLEWTTPSTCTTLVMENLSLAPYNAIFGVTTRDAEPANFLPA